MERANLLRLGAERRKEEAKAMQAGKSVSQLFGKTIDQLNEQSPETKKNVYEQFGRGGLIPVIEAEQSLDKIMKRLEKGQKHYSTSRYFTSTPDKKDSWTK